MQSETKRVEAFSDAVFAIAITLLILEIKVPTQDQGHLADQLRRQWPSYLAFITSFAYIGIMWINHHRMFTHIRKCNDMVLALNLLLLLGVTVVPFPTAVLAEHLSGPDRGTGAVLYNATFVFIAVAFNLLWRYAVARRLLDESVQASAANISRQYLVAPVMYTGCLVLAWFNVRASLMANFALSIFFALPPHWMRDRTPSGDSRPVS
jgi:TMEM175 potassium channel family protein